MRNMHVCVYRVGRTQIEEVPENMRKRGQIIAPRTKSGILTTDEPV